MKKTPCNFNFIIVNFVASSSLELYSSADGEDQDIIGDIDANFELQQLPLQSIPGLRRV